MTPAGEDILNQLRRRFRLTFQQRLREHLARQGRLPEAFAAVWERTLQEVRLDEATQAGIYWELFQWAHSYDLFTSDHPPAPPPAPVRPANSPPPRE